MNKPNFFVNFEDFADWSKKIIYAPNASGKTRVSNILYENLVKNKSVAYFTSKRIQELINISSVDIFVGETASIQKSNRETHEKYLNNETYDNYLRDKYNSIDIKKIKQVSAIHEYFNIKQARSVLDIFSQLKKINYTDNQKDLSDFSEEIDKYIDANIIKELKKIQKPEIFPTETKTIITKKTQDLLLSIFTVIKEYDTENCILCGYKYDSHDLLIKAIRNQLSKFSSEETEKVLDNIEDIWIRIIEKNNQESILWNYLTRYPENIESKFIQLKEYESLFDANCTRYLMSIERLFPSIYEEYDEFNKNERMIEDEKRRLTFKPEFQRTIINEFQELAQLPENIVLNFDNQGRLGTLVDNKKLAPQEVLSDSELKRLSLAVLASTIEHNKTQYLILDDPIDSYDDYYIDKASKYIGNLVSKFSNIDWTVFSHFYESIIHIASKNRDSKIIVYYQDPNYINNPITLLPPILKTELGYSEFEILRDHEIELVKNVISSKPNGIFAVQKDFLCLSLFGTIRAIVLDIVPQYSVDSKSAIPHNNTKSIEETYLHFSLKNQKTFTSLESIYINWFKSISKKSLFHKSSIPGAKKLSEYRREILSDYNSIKVINPLLKMVLYKILWMTEAKYTIEEKLYNRMKSNGESDDNINFILNIHKLGSKIDAVSQIDAVKYNDFKLLHNQFSNLINDYSHSTLRMVPPYISLSILDFRRLIDAINKL